MLSAGCGEAIWEVLEDCLKGICRFSVGNWGGCLEGVERLSRGCGKVLWGVW